MQTSSTHFSVHRAAHAAPGRPAAPRQPGSRAHLIVCRDVVGQKTPTKGHDPDKLVNRVLEKIAHTDGGVNMSEEQKGQVDLLLDELETIGRRKEPRPLDNPWLWGNYEVAYTSTLQAPTERGQPAGGRFRGRIGRSLFRTTGVFQSVLKPDVVTNKVAFKLFGCIPGAVGLRGKVVPVEAGEPHGPGTAGVKDTVKVLFRPPVLSLGENFHFKIGPPSSVQLSTTYLDERVRLGKGSRGSLFVFLRGGAADRAGMDMVGLQRTTKAGVAWLAAAVAALVGGGCALWSTGITALKVLAGGMWLVTALLAAVLNQGGIVRDDDDVQQTQKLQQEQEQLEQAKLDQAKAEQDQIAKLEQAFQQ